MTPRAVVFLGPTLSESAARDILDAIYLPPAREADLISAVMTYQPRIIGLVDGAFAQSLSVWHKEILFALTAGVHVYGASSIGALRAAETSVFGTVGVGEVYRLYASGELEDDDEVAVAHTAAEDGYRTLSVPVVNLRSTLARAREQGICDQATCDVLLGVAKAIYYPERTFRRLLDEALQRGLPAAVVDTVRRFLDSDYVDIKRQDAITLLQTIRDLPADLPPFVADFQFEQPHYFRALYERDRTVRHSGVDVALHAVADYAALHLPDFGDLNFQALNRTVLVEIADVLGLHVPTDSVALEASRFRDRFALQNETDFHAWLSRNDTTLDEWRGLMREVAVCRHLQRWLMLRKRTGNTRTVLDQLRLTGRYEEVCGAATDHERILQTVAPEDLAVSAAEVDMRELVVDHVRQTRAQIGPEIAEWAEEAGFETVAELQVELLRARLARQRLGRAAQALMNMLKHDADKDDTQSGGA